MDFVIHFFCPLFAKAYLSISRCYSSWTSVYCAQKMYQT